MKQTLQHLFKTYGDVLDVVAHSNIRMRGQAFVSFQSKDMARKAMKEVKGFPLYNKPMVLLLCHSQVRTDVIAASIVRENAVGRCSSGSRRRASGRAQEGAPGA